MYLLQEEELYEELKLNCKKLSIEVVDSFAETPVSPYLLYNAQGLYMCNPSVKNQKPISSDFLTSKMKKRLSAENLHKENLKKTLGKKYVGKNILDATPGFGIDAMIFFHLGLNVFASEINPVAYLLLKDGLRRFFPNELGNINKFNLNYGDSLPYFNQLKGEISYVYIDLMFISSDKKSKSKKEMEVFKVINKVETEQEQLNWISSFFDKKWSRLILKRPKKSKVISNSLFSHSLFSNSIRFDIYIKSK